MRRFTIILAILAITLTSQAEEKPIAKAASTSAKATADKTDGKQGRHLFILSGQSNMHRLDSTLSFTPAVEEAFGMDNVIVVKSAMNGAAIRYWDKDYKWPEGRPEKRGRAGKEAKPKEFGCLYDPLMEAVKKKTAGHPSYDTVTLIWMQGETDAGEDLTDLYIDSFQRILARLKSDLKIESIHVVIGRLSDWGLEIPKIKAASERMREIQLKFAENHPNCAWVNTDDLNDKPNKDGTVNNSLHYTEEGYKILGARFAEKAIELIK